MASDAIVGRCVLMCPEEETLLREKEGLLHRFEIDDKTKYDKKPKADPNITVKCFSRPAAGQDMTNPDLLRSPHTLLCTIRYLFTRIVTRSDVDWTVVYDFVFDRLRAIRQDIVVQRIIVTKNILLLEPIIRFYIYAEQRLCERNITEFDPVINKKHLIECIQQLLVLYDHFNSENMKGEIETHLIFERMSLYDNQSEMESLNILLHIGNQTVLKRGLALPSDVRDTPIVQIAMKISLAWYLRNYIRVYRLVLQLPTMLRFAFFYNLRRYRRDVLNIICCGYNSKVITFPGLKLQEFLFYKDTSKILADCKLFGMVFVDGDILFQKALFNKEILLAEPEMLYTPTKLHTLVPKILLEQTST